MKTPMMPQEKQVDKEQNLLWCADLAVMLSPPSEKEWERLLDELGDTAPPDAPLLSDYAVSREGVYEGLAKARHLKNRCRTK